MFTQCSHSVHNVLIRAVLTLDLMKKKKTGEYVIFTEASGYLVPNLIRIDQNRISYGACLVGKMFLLDSIDGKN